MFEGFSVQELVILLVILAVLGIQTIGMYWVAKRVGYSRGSSVVWTVGFLFFGGFALLLFGRVGWPRDKVPST